MVAANRLPRTGRGEEGVRRIIKWPRGQTDQPTKIRSRTVTKISETERDPVEHNNHKKPKHGQGIESVLTKDRFQGKNP